MGDNLYNKGQVYKSCDKYALAYKKIGKIDREEKAQLAEKIGDIYYSVNEYKKSYLWYRRALFTKDTVSERCYKVLNLAYRMNRTNELRRYEEKYNISVDTSILFKSPRRYLIRPFDKLNSRYDDFSPSFLGIDTTVLYFTSNRKTPGFKRQSRSPVSGDYHANIYKTEFTDEIRREVIPYGKKKVRNVVPRYKTVLLDTIQWIRPVPVKDSLLNSTDDDGVMCFNRAGTKAYFSSSRRYKGRYIGAKLFSADCSTDGELVNIKRLHIVGDTVNIGHPAISPDGDKLYYVSSMQGGQGKLDIWYSVKTENVWSKPINAGEDINSSGNEMFPSFDNEGNLLISSDGHQGLGGLDIFRVNGEYGKYSLENLAYPLNSRSDDFGIIYVPGYDKGYLTSSRGGKGDEDIYYFKYDPFTFDMEVRIIDKKLKIPIENAFVIMTDTNGKKLKARSDENGITRLKWIEKSEANFVVHRAGYLKTQFSLDTRDVWENSSYEMNCSLNKMDAIIEIPNIFYEFAKSRLTQESKESLKGLIVLLNDNPNITIELASHSDMIGDAESNNILSQERAQSVVDFLIEQHIDAERLTPKGYGESAPKTVSYEESEEYDFLKVGQKLSPTYITRLKFGEQEIVNQLNRRTEFRVLRQDYIPKKYRKK
jgi:peptidoglycan-associated lipoprotein